MPSGFLRMTTGSSIRIDMKFFRHSVAFCSFLFLAILLCRPSAKAGNMRNAANASAVAQNTIVPNPQLANKALNQKVDALLARMTLDEKVGQLVQYSFGTATGPEGAKESYDDLIAHGQVGSLLNVNDAGTANRLQHLAVDKSRLHIPLLYGLDVIHGYRTVFPVPLGLASSFDPQLAQATARVAAEEASSVGIRWTFSPMVDIARDARWGRIVEGAGESPFLGAAMAAAYVRGYQGSSLSNPDSIAACVKHFAAYGAVIAGRDYNAVDMSDLTLRQVYLPPYQAAIDAGAATVMSSFNTLNGVPATANPYTLTEILRKEWSFQGFVVSDWDAIGELVPHGVATDTAIAARKAIQAGLDMDMVSGAYHEHLAELVQSGAVPQATLDEAVRRVLRVKFALGLFDHPYVNSASAVVSVTPQRRALARKAAEESIVLLQNRSLESGTKLLPISNSAKTIALIGPMADAQDEMLGSWAGAGQAADAITLRTALEQRLQKTGGRLLYAEGTQLLTDSTAGFEAAKQAAEQSDLVVMALGEDASQMTGEAASRAHLGLPGNQQQLLETVAATGKPIVLVLFNGHPLVLDWAAKQVGAIVEAWYPGIEAGNALGDILFGDVNPSGKLPVSLPRAVGQEPLYLAQSATGRPASGVDLSHPPANSQEKYVSRYIDVPNSPLFPFGQGLSYTQFTFSPVKLNRTAIPANDVRNNPNANPIEASVEIRNSGNIAGTEVAQLYLQIRGASVEEPVRVLKGFQRVTLQPGESRQVKFPLGFTELSIINAKSKRVVEPAEYTVFIGGDSQATESAKFTVTQ